MDKKENALSLSTLRQMKLGDVAQRKPVNLGPHSLRSHLVATKMHELHASGDWGAAVQTKRYARTLQFKQTASNRSTKQRACDRSANTARSRACEITMLCCAKPTFSVSNQYFKFLNFQPSFLNFSWFRIYQEHSNMYRCELSFCF